MLPSTPLTSLINRLSEYRKSLVCPGRTEDLHRKSQNVFATQSVFDGAKFDLLKGVSENLQMQHSFSMGSKVVPSSYNFGGVYYKGGLFMQGMVDGSGSSMCRLILPIGAHADPKQDETVSIDNHKKLDEYVTDPFDTANNNTTTSMATTSSEAVLRGRVQYGGQHELFQLELERNGPDYNVGVSCINPSPINGSGIFGFSYMQALTTRLALGVDFIKRVTPKSKVNPYGSNDNSYALHVRYKSPRYTLPDPDPIMAKDETLLLPEAPITDPTLNLTLHSMGMLQASYHLPVSKKTELAAELNVAAGQRIREGVASVGVKYEFTQSTFRTMIDTTGKVSSYLESRLTPAIILQLSGEVDHLLGDSRFGIGLQLEI